MDLMEFLRARLDEDEQAAKAATSGPWRYSEGKHWRKPGTSWFEEAVFAGEVGRAATCVAGTGETDDPQSMADAAFIARHDPARALAEVTAKRRILQRYADNAVDEWPLFPLLELAAVYADHPDYREEWRV